MGLPTKDPFAVTSFILLIFVILLAIFMLIVTIRRSAEDEWNAAQNASRHRALHRNSRLKYKNIPPPSGPPRNWNHAADSDLNLMKPKAHRS